MINNASFVVFVVYFNVLETNRRLTMISDTDDCYSLKRWITPVTKAMCFFFPVYRNELNCIPLMQIWWSLQFVDCLPGTVTVTTMLCIVQKVACSPDCSSSCINMGGFLVAWIQTGFLLTSKNMLTCRSTCVSVVFMHWMIVISSRTANAHQLFCSVTTSSFKIHMANLTLLRWLTTASQSYCVSLPFCKDKFRCSD